MGWRGSLKGVAMFILISVSVVSLWLGVVQTLFGRPWMRLVGLATAIAAFRGIIWAFDLMWGRPPAFSKRPWEQEPRHPRGP